MASTETVFINGNSFAAQSGETIFQVATRHHIEIPTLCHLKKATSSGNCGVCSVEINGSPDLQPSCQTKIKSGMEVYTESERVIQKRKEIIRKFLATGNHNCAISNTYGRDWTGFQLKVHDDDGAAELCPVWGDCRLQDLAYRYQVTGDELQRETCAYPIEDVNPFILRDFSRCILCGMCVRACNEIQVNDAIRLDDDHQATKVIAGEDKPLRESDCLFCGECIQACPVGALVEKDVRYRVRNWETEKIRTTCSYCGVGCQLYLHVKEGKVVKVSGVDAPPNYKSLCVKGRFGFDFIHSPDRLTKPMVRKNGTLVETSWDEALDLVAEKLGQIKKDHSPDHIGLLTSARMTNEENYIAQKFARGVIKTNNVDHCARL